MSYYSPLQYRDEVLNVRCTKQLKLMIKEYCDKQGKSGWRRSVNRVSAADLIEDAVIHYLEKMEKSEVKQA